MDLLGFPFGYRVLILLLVLSAVAGFDALRNGKQATRWREYVFLLVCASVGAVGGVLTDALTSRISPEYFTLGKGVRDGDGFLSRVLLLGAHAGFLAGAVVAISCLIANDPRRGATALPYRALSGLAMFPLASAAIGGLVAGVLLASGVARSVVPLIGLPVDSHRAEAFLSAWGIHTGIYAGLVAGLVVAVVRVRRRRAAVR